MAYQIQGNVIINDSRELVGVATAGINDALYVGDVEIKNNEIKAAGSGIVTYYGNGAQLEGVAKEDGSNLPADLGLTNVIASGYVSVGQTFSAQGAARFDTSIQFGAAPTTIITGFSTDGQDMGGATASDQKLPTEKAVKEFVGQSISGGVDLRVNGDAGTVNLNIGSGDPLVITGATGQIETEVVVGGGSTELVVGFTDSIGITSDVSVGRDLTVTRNTELEDTTIGAGSTLTLNNLELGGTTVRNIGLTTDLGGASPNAETLPTQKAVKEYVDAQVGGNANLEITDGASGITTISLASEQLVFSEVANETSITVANDQVTIGLDEDVEITTSLKVGGSNLSVDGSFVESDLPAKFDGDNGSGIGLSVTNSVDVNGSVYVGFGVSAASFRIGAVEVSEFATDDELGGGSASDSKLPTQKAVKDYVDNNVSSVGILSFFGNDNTVDAGEVEIATEALEIRGVANQLVASIDSASNPVLNIGFAQTATFPGRVSVGNSLTVQDESVLNGDVIAAGKVTINGTGVALDVANQAKIGVELETPIVKAPASGNLKLDGGGNAMSIENGALTVQNAFTASDVINAEAGSKGSTGIGLTVTASAYVSGDLTVDGTLLAAGGVDFDTIIATRVQAEGPEALILDGSDPQGNSVGVAVTNGNFSVGGATSAYGDVNLLGASKLFMDGGDFQIINAQIQADGAGIGLTVFDSAFIGGEISIGKTANLDSDLQFGSGQKVNEIVTSVVPTSTNEQIPTAAAVAAFIGGEVGDLTLKFTDGSIQGDIAAATEVLGLLGTTNQIDATVAAAGDNDITFSLPSTLVAPGSVESTGVMVAKDTLIAAKAGIGLSVVNGSEFSGAAVFKADSDFQAGLRVTAGIATIGELKLGVTPQSVSGISSDTALTSDSNSELPTVKAVKAYVDNAAGSVSNVNLADAADANTTHYVTFGSAATGSQQLKTDAGQLEYNPSTGILQAQEFNALSDIRYKENIELISDPLAKVNALRGVTFDWKDTEGVSAGIIAQEVQAVMPQLVSENEDKMAVNYNGLVGLLIEAVKELSARVEELESK